MQRRRLLPFAAVSLQSFSTLARADLIPPDQAFKAALVDLRGNTVTFKFLAASGYYLYGDKFTFELVDSDAKAVSVFLPSGATRFEPAFGRDVVYYRGLTTASVTLNQLSLPFKLKVGMQGCADVGVCYPPMFRTFVVERRNG